MVSSFLTLPCAACAVQLVLLVSTLWQGPPIQWIQSMEFPPPPQWYKRPPNALRTEDTRFSTIKFGGTGKKSIKPIAGWWYTYPSEKWWISSVGMMTFPIDGKVKNGPNHQPDSHTCSDLRLCIQFQECFVMQKVYLQYKEYSLPSSNKLKTAQNLSVSLRANTPIRPHPFYAVHLGISNVRLYIQLGRSTRVFREYKFPIRVKLYIHWRSSIRV